MTLISENR